jgi:hypothetical protein
MSTRLPYKKDKYKKNKSNEWALIYNQCLPELKNKLKGMSRYDTSKKDNHLVALLTMIRSYCCCCQFDTLNSLSAMDGRDRPLLN